MELFSRCRAWFITMAYVAIRKRDFFDLQTALFASERLFALVTQTFGGQSAPAHFFAGAWAATIHHFAEQIRVNGVTLKAAVLNTGAWEIRWTSWSPVRNDSGNASSGNQHASADLPKDLWEEVQTLKQSVKHWQSLANKYESEAERFREIKNKGSMDQQG